MLSPAATTESAKLKDDARNVDTWDPLKNCALLEGDLSAGLVAPPLSPLLDAANKCFLVIGCSETCKSVSLTLHIIGQTTCFKFVLIQLTKELK